MGATRFQSGSNENKFKLPYQTILFFATQPFCLVSTKY